MKTNQYFDMNVKQKVTDLVSIYWQSTYVAIEVAFLYLTAFDVIELQTSACIRYPK